MWILYVLILAVVISAAIAGASAAPWLPTRPKDRHHILGHLDLRPGQTIVDLGCGDGSLLFAVARQFPGVICVGYDISLLPLFLGWSRKLLKYNSYQNVHIRFGNLFRQELKDADVVFLFLLPKSYERLLEILRRDLKDDARVAVEAWPLPGVEPTETLKKEGHLSIFLYTGKALRHVE